MRRAVLFDLDYTLFDTGAFYRSAFRAMSAHLSERHGADPSAMYAALHEGWLARTSSYPRLFDDFLADADLPLEEVGVLVDMLHDHRTELCLFDDAIRFLDLAPAHLPLGIVTDGNGRMQRNKLAALDLGDRFDPVVITGECGPGWAKPSPRPFLEAARRLALPPGDIVYVGDNPARDAAGPRSIGMASIRVVRGEYAAVEASGDQRFDATVDELDHILTTGLLERI